MSRVDPSIICERMRGQISLELDGQLSQLERAMLEGHIDGCADCRSYQAEVSAFTGELRNARLAPLEHTVVVRRPRRQVLARLQVAAAAMLMVAAVGVATQLAAQERPGPARLGAASQVSRFPSRGELEREIAILESLQGGMTAGRRPFAASRPVPV
jgi:predicted anti-sigma-YlaC factor YlaD